MVKLGVIGTRRNLFSKEDAIQYNYQILTKCKELKIDVCDILDINEEGLLFDEKDLDKIIDKMKYAKVNALFFPHCNFGTEDLVAKVAKALQVPVCIWGPKDEAPLQDGSRLRDSQCGLFATGKILRRFQIPFTYMNMCRIEDQEFSDGLLRFVSIAKVVNAVKTCKILQISTRPAGFWTMMVNEGELLEKFNIQIHPISLEEVKQKMNQVLFENSKELQNVCLDIETKMILLEKKGIKETAALKIAMKRLANEFSCSAVAIQCWNAMQDVLGIFPCVANALLTEDGIPVACETDIHGAISLIIAQNAAHDTVPFFADWTVPHPSNPNGELLQHCGPFPPSLMKETPKFGSPFAFHHSHPGALHGEIKGGKLSILRFDGDNGEYSVLLGHARGIEGPFNQGTYLWIEVENLKRLEAKLVSGPYVHHCVGIHEDILPVVYEACKYLNGIKPDFYDMIEEKIKAEIRGE